MRTLNQSGDTPKRTGTESVFSTARVESTVNQLINWGMCKKIFSYPAATPQ
jgi:hypothetical protein